MTSLLYRGAVVLSADNIDEILVPNGLPIAEGINGSITIPDALPGRVRSMGLYLCDSTQAPHFDTDPYWFYKVYPHKFLKVDFNKVVSNADLLNTIDYYIDLLERIIVFYDDVIEDTLAKQELYGITYNIDNSWTRLYYYVYGILYAPDLTQTANVPITFIDTYNILKALAISHKDHLEAKYAEVYNSGVTNTRIGYLGNTPTNFSSTLYYFFYKPYARFTSASLGATRAFFQTKRYKTSLADNGLILYGGIRSRDTHENIIYRTDIPNPSSVNVNPWPYKYSYENTKWEDPLKYITDIRHSTFSTFNSRYVTGFAYLPVILQNLTAKFPLINYGLELKRNQFQEIPYEYYPDMVGCFDFKEFETYTKATKTRTKHFYGDPRINSHPPTDNNMGLHFQHNTYHLQTKYGYYSGEYTLKTPVIDQTKLLANGLTERRNYAPLLYGARYQHRLTGQETRISLWQAGNDDLNNQGSNSASFPRRFEWVEDSENPVSMYVRSRTHIYETPSDAGFISFDPTSDVSITPYTNWFGGSTENASLLKIKVIYDDGVLDPNYFWIRLQSSKAIPSIEYTAINNTVNPPADFTIGNFSIANPSSPNYESGTLEETVVINEFRGLRYKRLIMPSGGVLIIHHLLERYVSNVLTNSFHLYTTQHHFSEPV